MCPLVRHSPHRTLSDRAMKKLEAHTLGFDSDAKLKSHDHGLVPVWDVGARVCIITV